MQGWTTLAGRFEVGEAIGTGGMGTVHRALDFHTGRTVAVKLLTIADVQDVERFVREAAALASLTHPGIVRYIAHGTADDGRHYLVMDWIDGDNLVSRAELEGLTIRETVLVIRQVAEALAEAHRHHMIHRDIKPDNLMLDGDALDQVRVVDFGLARYVADDQHLTRTGIAMGTPGYMSPEQARGSRDLDGRSDIFSLGCVLYECLAGRPPFLGENPMAVQVKLILVDPPPVTQLCPEVPPGLAEIVVRMLAKDPEDRFATMCDVARALAELHGLPDAMRHRARVSEPASGTRRIGAVAQPPAPCLVLVAPPKPIPAWRPRALEAITPWRDRAEVLDDGVIVMSHPGAADAARCALALARTLPDATIVVSAPAADDVSGESAIDRSTQLMSVAALRSIFARGAAAGQIHVDPVTAALLRPHFEITGSGEDLVLRGERG
ncbi:MAG: serine/threonine protein kinase [Myxococcota bacterium]|nr:serine/threonine protein kinase [Myxococcota bacterium]